MIRRILIATTLLAGTAASRAPAPQANPTLQIAVEDAADPWSRADGAGFANDIVRAAFIAVNVDVKLIVVPYARCKTMVVSGTVVACFAMSPAPEFRGTVLFPATPLFSCYTELVQNPAHPLSATRLKDLPLHTVVGTVLGYEYPKEVLQAEVAGNIKLDASPTEPILLRKLAANRVDAALVNVNESKPLDYVAARGGLVAGFQAVARVGTQEAYVGFSARNPRGTWARDSYDEGMRRIRSNGALARIERQWADSSRAVVYALAAEKRRGIP